MGRSWVSRRALSSSALRRHASSHRRRRKFATRSPGRAARPTRAQPPTELRRASLALPDPPGVPLRRSQGFFDFGASGDSLNDERVSNPPEPGNSDDQFNERHEPDYPALIAVMNVRKDAGQGGICNQSSDHRHKETQRSAILAQSGECQKWYQEDNRKDWTGMTIAWIACLGMVPLACLVERNSGRSSGCIA